ncbi:MAG TPA: hypothetical protein VF956_06415 [Candidatus Dormibacteraeota bacterium]
MATAIYVAALLPNAVVGMPMPPIFITRLIASLSVFVAAPALVWMVVLIGRGRPSKRILSRMALFAAVAFATMATLNRVVQLAILTELGGYIDARFDLYTPSSPANFIEMFAWDLCLGIAAVAVSRLLSEPTETWASRMFAGAGLLMLLGELLYVMTLLKVGGSTIGLAGMGVSVVAWVLGLPAAALCVVIATRPTRASARTSPG